MNSKILSWLEMNLYFGSFSPQGDSKSSKLSKLYKYIQPFFLPLVLFSSVYLVRSNRLFVENSLKDNLYLPPVASEAVSLQPQHQSRSYAAAAAAINSSSKKHFFTNSEISSYNSKIVILTNPEASSYESGLLNQSDQKSKTKSNVLAIGTTMDLKLNLNRSSASSTDFQQKRRNFEQKLTNFQNDLALLLQKVELLRSAPNGAENALLPLQEKQLSVTRYFLEVLKDKFHGQCAMYGIRAFGWTNSATLASNPDYCGLSFRSTGENQSIALTREQLLNQFFYGQEQKYQRFQTVLDDYRNLENEIRNVNIKHQEILGAQSVVTDANFNLVEEFTPIRESVTDLDSAPESKKTSSSTRELDLLTLKRPSMISIQYYKKFSKMDLAACFRQDSTLSFGVGRCQTFSALGNDSVGGVVGLDVGGSYSPLTKKFGPHAKIFVGVGGFF